MTVVDDRYFVQSVGRAVELLELIARQARPVPLNELVQLLGWTKPTVYRLVRTLEATGMLRELAGSGYVIGPRAIAVGSVGIEAHEVRNVARPHMERLHDATGESVNLTVAEGAEILYIERVEDKQILGVRLRVGSRLPIHQTSQGHVLLANLSSEALDSILADVDYGGAGPASTRDRADLDERLEAVRRLGYAINDQMLAPGLRSAAAPIRDHTGATVAALNISVAAARITTEELVGTLVPQLVATAQAISSELGHKHEDPTPATRRGAQ
jgi:IclR family pca regulon transcriptional regulator